MKKTYETMEAFKVCFNANEQVAAAACTIGGSIADKGRKMAQTAGGPCAVSDHVWGAGGTVGAAIGKYATDNATCTIQDAAVSNYL